MEAYFEALGQFETAKEPLRTQLERCAHDFTQALARQYTPKTIRKHAQILTLFIDFVCWDTDVRRIDEITRGIANSHFRQWYQRKVGDRTESELKTTMKKFFHFLAEEKGIRRGSAQKLSALTRVLILSQVLLMRRSSPITKLSSVAIRCKSIRNSWKVRRGI